MNNQEKYLKVFMDTFDIDREQAENGDYDSIKAWDSIGHMQLINNIEAAFDIYFEIEDIVELSSFESGKELLRKYDVEIG